MLSPVDDQPLMMIGSRQKVEPTELSLLVAGHQAKLLGVPGVAKRGDLGQRLPAAARHIDPDGCATPADAGRHHLAAGDPSG